MKLEHALDFVDVVEDANMMSILKSKIKGFDLEKIDDAFYVCDLGDIIHKHKLWLHSFKRIKPFYAIKCNPNDTMLKLLIKMGTGFDCASKAEIQRMISLGASPESIIFANPCKPASHIKYACNIGVNLTVFDNEEELYKIKRLHPSTKLVLRIQTDDSAAVCRFSMKFGANPLSCLSLLEKAKELELNVVGVSFHVGSGCQDPAAYTSALRNARKVFEHGTQLGYDFNLLDIGGGFSGSHDQLPLFKKIANVVNTTLDDLFPANEWPDLDIIAEPGRFYAASAFSLATNIIAKRDVSRDIQTYTDDNSTKDAVLNSIKPGKCDEPAYMYFLNDGLYGSFNCLFYDHAVIKPTLLGKQDCLKGKFSSSIWGPSCDGLDKLMDCCLLPELAVGQWIIWHEMGAYTISASSSFNGFKTSKIHYVISKKDLHDLESMCYGALPNFVFKELS